MKAYLLIAAMTAVCACVFAGAGQRLDWDALELGPAVTRAGDGEQGVLRIDRSQVAERQNVVLFHLQNPAVTGGSYALIGEVRYEGMPAGSFLETWNHFPVEKGGTEIGASYFSRTLGESGPMGKLSGSKGWRAFELPFFVTDGSGRVPLRISFAAQFEGPGGMLEVRNLRLVDGLGPAAGLPAFGMAAGLGIGIAAGAALASAVAWILWRSSRRSSR